VLQYGLLRISLGSASVIKPSGCRPAETHLRATSFQNLEITVSRALTNRFIEEKELTQNRWCDNILLNERLFRITKLN